MQTEALRRTLTVHIIVGEYFDALKARRLAGLLGCVEARFGRQTRDDVPMPDTEDKAEPKVEHKAAAPEQLAHKPINHPSLTTPCTALALRNWLISLESAASGDFWETQVTTTSTSITVA